MATSLAQTCHVCWILSIITWLQLYYLTFAAGRCRERTTTKPYLLELYLLLCKHWVAELIYSIYPDILVKSVFLLLFLHCHGCDFDNIFSSGRNAAWPYKYLTYFQLHPWCSNLSGNILMLVNLLMIVITHTVIYFYILIIILIYYMHYICYVHTPELRSRITRRCVVTSSIS